MKALVLYPQYGLANRLRAIASARILADFTGRKLFVNWIRYSKCNIEWEDLFLNRLDRYPLPATSFTKGVTLYDDNNDVSRFYWDMPQSLTGNPADVVAVRSCCNFQTREMSRETYTSLKSLFYRSLQPLDSIQKTVDDLYRRYFEGNKVVGLHIRRADHLYYRRKDPRLVSPTSLFIESMEKVLKSNPDTRFFLATDDRDEERAMRERFGVNVIVYEKENISRNTQTGMQDALVDWLLLSKSSRIIGSSTSSFSEEAAVVNMIEREPIVKEGELSRTHYNMLFKPRFNPYFRVLRDEGFRNFFSYSYNYRKGQILSWIRRKFLTAK